MRPAKISTGRAMLGGAAYEPDSAGKMPTGPTAKMAVLRLGFIPKNCRAAIFAAVFFLLAAEVAALQFLAPGPDAEDATRRLSSPNASRKTDQRPVWRTDLSVVRRSSCGAESCAK